MFYRDNAALLCLFSHVSSCFHDRPSDNPHMLHSNKTSQFLLLASLPWQPDSFLEPTFLLAYLTQSRGRRPACEIEQLRQQSGLQAALGSQKSWVELVDHLLGYRAILPDGSLSDKNTVPLQIEGHAYIV